MNDDGAVPSTMSASDERVWAILAHLSTPISLIFSVGWLGFLGPLAVWFFFKEKSGFVRTAAARSFNYSIVLLVIAIVGWVCIFTIILIPVGIILFIILLFSALFFPIRAAFTANKNRMYRYPFSIGILE